jgi:hypothetical protein
MSVEFRFARLDEYEPISQFIGQYWASEHIYTRSKALFDWTFSGRPDLWHEQGYSFSLAEAGGELVGILGGIPFELNAFGEKSLGVWIVNYVIRPDHRRGASALQLLSTLRKPPFNATIAFGINPATATIYKVLRGRVLERMPRHFLVLPQARDRMANLLNVAYPDWNVDRCRALADSFRLDGMADTYVASVDGIPEGWDAQEWPRIAAKTVGAARDQKYLEWRYQRHPLFEYKTFSVAEGDARGLVVWRMETIHQATEQGRKPVDKIARLVEFLPVSKANGEALLQRFLQEACTSGALGADYYGYHGPTRQLLTEQGFVDTAANPEGDLIPSRFQPLDGKGGGIMSATFLSGHLPACDGSPECPWYWTKTDSDQDRPN